MAHSKNLPHDEIRPATHLRTEQRSPPPRLAAVIIGHDIGLFNEEILNGTIVMILVTCIISTLVTEKAARRIVIEIQNNEPASYKSPIQNEQILIPVANPDTIENLINLALLLKSPQKKSALYALHVTDDDKKSNFLSQAVLEYAGKVASSADTKLIPIARYDMNITSGIIHTMKEKNITEVVLGLHHKANIVDTFFGAKIESLLKSTNKMILISKCVNPINTVTRIVIAVPRKAEYETGFARWIDRVANHGETNRLPCHILCLCRNHSLFESPVTSRKIQHQKRI